MKIYTKTGDAGTTSLFGGKRVFKNDVRIEAYGTVDELNAFIGVLLTYTEDQHDIELLTEVQNRLFTIGSNLASDPEKEMITPDLKESDIELLEKAMDNMEVNLPKLRTFILPGGHASNAHAHLCRTICRRAERRVISLSEVAEVEDLIIKYLNRLSDYFFVLARKLSSYHGAQETPWVAR